MLARRTTPQEWESYLTGYTYFESNIVFPTARLHWPENQGTKAKEIYLILSLKTPLVEILLPVPPTWISADLEALVPMERMIPLRSTEMDIETTS